MRVIGNFKMNLLLKDLISYEQSSQNLWIAPQLCHLSYFKNKNLNLGAQNCHYELEGPFTGEISPKALKDLGVKFVLLNHKERQGDLFLEKRVQKALEVGLEVIYCLGEEKKGEEIKTPFYPHVTYAYEPYWCIGSGLVPEKSYLEEKLSFLREKTQKDILYGGSVNKKNIEFLLEISWDGFLIGGASLIYEDFLFLNETCLNHGKRL